MHAIYREMAKIEGEKDAARKERYEREISPEEPYTSRELRFAYEMVCIEHNYSATFTTTIAPDMLPLITRAVRYFTNTDLIVLGTDHLTGRLMVQSKGK